MLLCVTAWRRLVRSLQSKLSPDRQRQTSDMAYVGDNGLGRSQRTSGLSRRTYSFDSCAAARSSPREPQHPRGPVAPSPRFEALARRQGPGYDNLQGHRLRAPCREAGHLEIHMAARLRRCRPISNGHQVLACSSVVQVGARTISYRQYSRETVLLECRLCDAEHRLWFAREMRA
jgi:hypothetical protein